MREIASIKTGMEFDEGRVNKGLKDKLMFYTVCYLGEEYRFNTMRGMFHKMKELMGHRRAKMYIVAYTEYGMYVMLNDMRCIVTNNCIADEVRCSFTL